MKATFVTPVCMALSMALLSACQKPATETAADTTAAAANAAQDTSAAATTATANVADPGGAVSPAQSNGAVNTDANKTTVDAAAASNSFTEGQAKGHIENAGYSDVTNLSKTSDGLWTAMAKKAGKPVTVTVDFKGAITAK